MSAQLTGDYGLKDVSRETHDEANATVEMVKDVEKRLGPLAKLQEMSKTTEERMATLNALAEHVTQKIKALENQKHTVEHAVVEANRLNEMVWAMEVQINKLNEGARQATRTEELIDRVEKLSREVGGAARSRAPRRATRSRWISASSRRIAPTLTDFVRAYTDKLAIERKEFDAFDQRVKALQGSVAEAEKGMEALAVRDRLSRRRWRSASISWRSRCRRSTPTPTSCRRSRRRSTACRNRSAQVDELAKRTAWQYENLKQSRQDLDSLRKEIQDFYKSHAAAVQLRDRLDRRPRRRSRRSSSGRPRSAPACRSSTRGWTRSPASSRSSTRGRRRRPTWSSIADDLDRQMTRIASQQQFVERVEARLNSLNVLTGEVDRKLDEQIARRGEVEALRSQIDGVAIEVTDARQKLEGGQRDPGQAAAADRAAVDAQEPDREGARALRRGAAGRGDARGAGEAPRRDAARQPQRAPARAARARSSRCRGWPRKSAARR